MRAFWFLTVVLCPLVTSAATDEDRAICRAAHPGKANIEAYLKCQDQRERDASDALVAKAAAERKRIEAELPSYNLEQARAACVRYVEACDRARELEDAERVAAAQQAETERVAAAERDAAAQAEAEKRDAEEEARLVVLRKKCGKDYGRVRRGMIWGKRIQECAGPFVLVREDEAGEVYEAQGGLVRVRGGKVTAWTAR